MPTQARRSRFNQDVSSTQSANVLVDFEVYDGNGQKVVQSSLDNQSVSPDAVASFNTTVTLPDSLPPGQYTLKTGVFAAGGGTRYAWTDSAGTFVVNQVAQAPPAQPDSSDATADLPDSQP